MAAHWHLQFFDGLIVRSQERTINRFRTQKTAALLALLALKKGPQRREDLCATLWPDAAPELARNSLSAALSALRRELGEKFVHADRYTVSLAPAAFDSDILEFEAALRNSNWAGAVQLYKGAFLPGFHEDPLPALCGAYEEKARHAFAGRRAELESAKEWNEVLELARRSIVLFGNETQAFDALMRAHHGLGDDEAALRAYSDWQKWAQRENGILPDAARQLARQLRRELGAHNSASEKATTESTAQTPQKSATHIKAKPVVAELEEGTLPLQWTRFFGRERQIENLVSLLRGGERLVTLTGSGGAGKTRLSLEVAKRLSDEFDNHIFFVPLAPLFDPALLLVTIRDALKLPSGSDLPPAQQIAGAIGEARVLILLDNFEQLAEDGAARLQSLREAVPHAQFLVTSRILLGLPGEREWSLPPLSGDEARELFLDRSGGRWGDDEHAMSVDELCRSLDDLPLAIELAAARAALLSPDQIRERLTGKLDFLSQRGATVEPRHRSLRAAIEWSFDLLDPELRSFFLSLSTFSDGWTIEAACAIGQVEEVQALDWLARLREHSLITANHSTGEPRFRMLMMLREWAQEQLSATELAALQKRHFAYYLDFIDRHATPQALASQEQSLVIEVPNFRGALGWALGRSDAAAAHDAARLCGALFPLWDAFSQFLIGRQWIGRTLQKANEPGQSEIEPPCRAIILACGGFAFWYCGEFEAAKSMFEESIEIAQSIGDDDTQAFALSGLSRVVMTLGQWQTACNYAEAGLEIARRTSNPARLINCLVAVGWSYHNVERHAQTRAIFRECFEIARAVGSLRVMSLARGMEAFSLGIDGDPQAGFQMMPEVLKLAEAGEAAWFCAFARAIYGILARECGQIEQARAHSPFAAQEFARIGTRWETSSGLTDCGMLAVALQDWPRGARILGAAEALRESINHPILPSIDVHYRIYRARLEEALPRDEFNRHWSSGRALSLDDALREAETLKITD